MASQKSKNNSTGATTSSIRLKRKKSDNNTKLNTRPENEIKPEMKFRKVKKISKSIKRIESEMSHIQIQMDKIGNDLASVLKLIETKKKI